MRDELNYCPISSAPQLITKQPLTGPLAVPRTRSMAAAQLPSPPHVKPWLTLHDRLFRLEDPPPHNAIKAAGKTYATRQPRARQPEAPFPAISLLQADSAPGAAKISFYIQREWEDQRYDRPTVFHDLSICHDFPSGTTGPDTARPAAPFPKYLPTTSRHCPLAEASNMRPYQQPTDTARWLWPRITKETDW